jgi:hypothetical protein
LRPLPIYLLPGFEREDLQLFRELNIGRVGEAAGWTRRQMTAVFGRRGVNLHQTLKGIDTVPVLPAGQKSPAVRFEREFEDDTNDLAVIESVLAGLVDKAGREIRKQGKAARRTAVQLVYSDGGRVIRQRSSPAGTADDFKLLALARSALKPAYTRRVRLRHMSLIVDRLTEPPSQLELFPEDTEEPRNANHLTEALDEIRSRFGANVIRAGRTLAGEV